MIQRGHSLGFAAEAVAKPPVLDLDSHVATSSGIVSLINLPLPPVPMRARTS